MAGLERVGASLGAGDDNRIGAADPTGSQKCLDVILAEQRADSVGQALDDAVLADEHRRQVELHAIEQYSVAAEAVSCQVKELARVEHGLARNAADVQARAAERWALLDAGHFEAELGGP